MIDPDSVPDVQPGELLARYVFARSHIRARDNSVKPDAFMPPPDLEMSVTRHLSATESELWHVGADVAEASCRELFGRADVRASDCLQQRLRTQKAPIHNNPNHAHIIDWPIDRAAQKSIAQELACKAAFTPQPTGH